MSIGLGVIGASGIADRRTIPEGIIPASNANLVAVMGRSEQRTRDVAEKYDVRWYLKEEELLDDKEVEAVYIATPNYLHARQTVSAIRFGKHVLCEKAMAMNMKEAKKMIDEAEKNERKLAIGYMMRFHGWHRKLKQMIEGGEIGTLVMGRAELTCWYPRIENAWRQVPSLGGGGALFDMGSHCIDLLEMLLGRASEITAFTDTVVQDYPVEDSSVVILHFESGAMGFVDAHFNVPDEASVNMLEIYGSKGKTVVSFVLRWNPLFKTIKRMIADDTLGDLYFVEADYQSNIASWWSGYEASRKKETGVSASLVAGCHAIDAIRWFAEKEEYKGAKPVEVFAYSGGWRKGSSVEYDYTTNTWREDMPPLEYDGLEVILVKFENGVLGKVSVNFDSIMPYVFPIELFGDKGSVKDNKVWSHKYPGQTDWVEIPSILPDTADVEHHPFQGEMDHFVECILEDKESHCNLEDAIVTHEIAFAALQCYETGAPVKLPLIT